MIKTCCVISLFCSVVMSSLLHASLRDNREIMSMYDQLKQADQELRDADFKLKQANGNLVSADAELKASADDLEKACFGGKSR